MSITAPILEICVPSGIFCWRNLQKVENGEVARGSVAFAQGAKIAQAVAQYNETVAKSTSSIFNNLAKESKIIDCTGKAVKWATKNVNPLICASGAIKVVTSKDKIGTGITEVGALAGMFAGEGLMKLHLGKVFNENNITNIAKSVQNKKGLNSISKFLLKSDNAGKLAAILKGITFVCGSIASYNLGQKLAQGQSDRIKAGLGIRAVNPEQSASKNEKIDQKA